MKTNPSRNGTLTSVKQPGKKAKNRGSKNTLYFLTLLILTALGGMVGGQSSPVAAQTPSKTSFTYQGQLLNNGARLTATCSFQFTLYDAATAGNIIGATQTVDNVTVKNSYFTTQLDFGLTPFGDTMNYLALAVKCPSDAAFTEMTTRVPLTPAPTALVAQKALALPWSGLSSVPSPLTFLGNPNPCTNGQVAKWNNTTWECAADTVTTYTAGTGLTLASGAFGVNFAGSGSAATAARSDHTHTLTAIDGVSIGATNPSTGKFTTLEAANLNITGGTPAVGKVLTSDASGAATWQTPAASASAASWGLSGNAGTTAGTNFIGTTDEQALEFKMGGTRVLRIEPTRDTPNIIGGYSGNNVASDSFGATIGGGGSSTNKNSVNGEFGTVSGGDGNSANGNSATVGGGEGNTASNYVATVGGGNGNTASSDAATVGGGANNNASGNSATVGGGQSNAASSDAATVGGGANNNVNGNSATVGGGNTNTASGNSATVGGGNQNTASGDYATVAGGGSNTASGNIATVGGGGNSTASGPNATVSGGLNNTASGASATVGGGESNIAAGNYSFAAGRRAKVSTTHEGTFLWADSINANFTSSTAKEFAVRATGGVRFVTAVDGSGTPTHGIQVTSNGDAVSTGSWVSTSDRNAKANFIPVDSQDVLSKVAALPLSTWNYKTQDAKIRHMGPMAQDLYQAFGLGEDDKHISTIDADGVALAAIQGLAQQTKTQQAQLETQKAQLETQQAEIALLKERLTTLEALLKQK